MKKKAIEYEGYYVNPRRVKTAVFEYLKRQGIPVNRKRGIRGVRESWRQIDGVWVDIDAKYYEKDTKHVQANLRSRLP